MPSIIIYASKHGATKAYAEWLSAELDIPAYSIETFKVADIQKARNVIIGSAIYMAHLRIADWLQDNWHHLREKNIALYSVSGTDPTDPALDKMIEDSLASNILDKMKVFHFPGRINRKKLDWWERFILDLAIRFEKNPEKKKKFMDGQSKLEQGSIETLENWLESSDCQSA